MIPGNEDSSRAGRNCIDLRLESAARIGPRECAVYRHTIRIDVVAEEYDHRTAGRFSGLSFQGIESNGRVSRIGLTSIPDQKQSSLYFLWLQILDLDVMGAR